MIRDIVILALAALSAASTLVSCASGYTPTPDRYHEELETVLHRHEDSVIVHYGKPTEVIELSEGTKLLVYEKLPYRGAPILNDGMKQRTCRTVFQVNEQLGVQFIKAEGNYCVK